MTKLSGEQRAAVEREGQDVCVVAGPGAGKTRVLIERFAWLVEQRGVSPSRILAITFTEKAAAEIKERLIKRLSQVQSCGADPPLRGGPPGPPSDVGETRTSGARGPRADQGVCPTILPNIERAWIDTIDGFCARLLREHAIAAGVAPDFDVLDSGPAARLLRESTEEALDELFLERPAEMRRLLEALDLSTSDDGRKPDLADALIDVYDAMRVTGITELPPGAPAGDAFPRARELARLIQIAPPGGNDSAYLRAWLGEFLALPAERLSAIHWNVLQSFSKVRRNNLNRKDGTYGAVTELKELAPLLTAQWIVEWNASLAELMRAALARLDHLYRAKKRAQAALDFSDLETDAIGLLESDQNLRRVTAERFEHILMDELQDTNPLQWRLAGLIRRRFFGVGDVNQSIYGFRHAESTLFQQYRRQVETSGGVIDDLRDNYRSRPEILEVVARVLEGAEGIEPRPLRAAGKFGSRDAPIVERIVGCGPLDTDVEAALVAARIRTLTDSGEFAFRDIAVLVRTLGALTPFERAFDRFDIPFLVSAGRTFLEAREIRDLTALLAALVNPRDEIALVCVLRSPLAGLSDPTILALGMEGCREEFERRFGPLRRRAGFTTPDRLLAEAVDRSGYARGLSERARANVEKLYSWARREHRLRPRPLAELLEDLEALRAMQSEAEAPPPEAGDVVRMMSIHAAKGLEFKVVFVSALHRGPDRSQPVLAFSPAAGLGAKWRHPIIGDGVPDAAYQVLLAERKQRDREEENRLWYVAMTRAEERLYLTYADRKQQAKRLRPLEEAVRVETRADQLADPPVARSRASLSSAEQIIDPPRLTGQYDSSAAVTSVALFHACPRKYYLGGYLGLEGAGRGGGIGAIELGLAVHRILAGEDVDHAEASELAARFAASDLGRRAARATRVEREFDFLLPVEDTVLRGQVDLWFEEGGELVLVDYKTDREESPEQYALQLHIYALALERYAGRRPDRAWLYYLRSNRALEVNLTGAGGALEVVREFLAAQDEGEFPIQPGEQCTRCEFHHGPCPAP